MDLTKMELGTSFEEVLEPAVRARLGGDRPGEFTARHQDGCKHASRLGVASEVCSCGAGTLFSPDWLLDDEAGNLVLGEFKCSYYSTTGAPVDPKFSRWWTQIKMYCYWLGITKARLFVMFVCGDYKPPSPVLKAWEAVFTQQELQDEITMITRHARKEGLLPAA